MSGIAQRGLPKKISVMVMSTLAVGMAMGHFLGSGVPDSHHFDVKNEIFAGKRVIAIEGHFSPFNSDHTKKKDFAVGSGRLELISLLQLCRVRKLFARNLHHKLLIHGSIGIGRLDLHLPLVSHTQQCERLFKAWNDLA